jgi:uncharacterized membrane protein YhaH (DUF805 family)
LLHNLRWYDALRRHGSIQGEIVMEYMLMPYRRLYRLIEGRAGRREYWMFTLFVFIITIVMVGLLIGVAGASALSFGQGVNPTDYGSLMAGAGLGMMAFFIIFYVWILLTGVASLGVTIRRIHDLNFSGWFLVLYYVVAIGALVVNKWLYLLVLVGGIVAMCLPGTQGPNNYGKDSNEADVDVEAFA